MKRAKNISDMQWAEMQPHGPPNYALGDVVEFEVGGYGVITEISEPHGGWPSSYATDEIKGYQPPPYHAWHHELDFKRLVNSTARKLSLAPTPTQAQIRARWKWDAGFKPTRENIRSAIMMTGNEYGITVHGVPYLFPVVGMRVKTDYYRGELGTIEKVGESLSPDVDPEVQIRLDIGKQIVYLHQTAIIGYVVLPKGTP